MSTLTTVGIALTAMVMALFLLAMVAGLANKDTSDATRRNIIIYMAIIISEAVVLVSLIAKG